MRLNKKNSRINLKDFQMKKILYTGSGDITIKYKYDDDPKISGLNSTDIGWWNSMGDENVLVVVVQKDIQLKLQIVEV